VATTPKLAAPLAAAGGRADRLLVGVVRQRGQQGACVTTLELWTHNGGISTDPNALMPCPVVRRGSVGARTSPQNQHGDSAPARGIGRYGR
jgi:hypothetical protein